jgi:hypothetical protein
MRSRLLLSTTLVIASLAFVCGDQRPVIRNCFSRAATVELSYTDGSRNELELEPGGGIWLGSQANRLTRAIFTVPGELPITVSPDDLDTTPLDRSFVGVGVAPHSLQILREDSPECS